MEGQLDLKVPISIPGSTVLKGHSYDYAVTTLPLTKSEHTSLTS